MGNKDEYKSPRSSFISLLARYSEPTVGRTAQRNRATGIRGQPGTDGKGGSEERLGEDSESTTTDKPSCIRYGAMNTSTSLILLNSRRQVGQTHTRVIHTV